VEARKRFGYFALCLVVAVVGCGREDLRKPGATPAPAGGGVAQSEKPSEGSRIMGIKLTSAAIKEGALIPRKYTGEGDDVSPPLAWESVPESTQEFALICDDPDAPSDEPWVHWVLYGIAADVREVPEGVPSNEPQLTKPIPARQGKNSWTSGSMIGYRGPMPPPGHGTHHYHFKLYALDSKLDLPPSATKQQLLDAMQGHVLAEGELIGTYERKH
jgi:Raf kinase inhibitor-like YbhB/YbcL family protein